jgi:hypothetical protein
MWKHEESDSDLIPIPPLEDVKPVPRFSIDPFLEPVTINATTRIEGPMFQEIAAKQRESIQRRKKKLTSKRRNPDESKRPFGKIKIIGISSLLLHISIDIKIKDKQVIGRSIIFKFRHSNGESTSNKTELVRLGYKHEIGEAEDILEFGRLSF